MDWANEKYVRLFVRDTVTWKMLPWQSRIFMPAVLRKLDRSGVLDLSGHGMAAIAAITEVPLEFVESAMPALLKERVFTMDADRLTMPNYIPAQETRQSDAQRKRDSREKRASGGDRKSPDVTSGHLESPEVTPTPVLPYDLPQTDPDSSRARSNEDAKPARYTGWALLQLFGSVRRRVLEIQAPPGAGNPTDSNGKAQAFSERLADEAQADVEPSMVRFFERVKAGASDKREATEPSFAFGAWLSRFEALREELHGCAPKVIVREDHQGERPRQVAQARYR